MGKKTGHLTRHTTQPTQSGCSPTPTKHIRYTVHTSVQTAHSVGLPSSSSKPISPAFPRRATHQNGPPDTIFTQILLLAMLSRIKSKSPWAHRPERGHARDVRNQRDPATSDDILSLSLSLALAFSLSVCLNLCVSQFLLFIFFFFFHSNSHQVWSFSPCFVVQMTAQYLCSKRTRIG